LLAGNRTLVLLARNRTLFSPRSLLRLGAAFRTRLSLLLLLLLRLRSLALGALFRARTRVAAAISAALSTAATMLCSGRRRDNRQCACESNCEKN
jgi:hypothetical protein